MPQHKKQKTWSLTELAAEAGGNLEGNGEIRVTGLAPIDKAVKGQITFLANRKYLPSLDHTRASAVILAPGIPTRIPSIQCENPYLAFARIARFMQQQQKRPAGISPDLIRGSGCRIGREVSIHPRVVLGGNVVIGDRVTLHPGVVIGDNSVVGNDSILYSSVSIREGIRIGERVIIHCGAVIGSDGFGFAPEGESYFKIPQMGGVVIEDDVEIGANTTIDRGTMGDTIIGKGTKIDNLVQIAHNVVIGGNTIVVSQVGISGSTHIGEHVTLAGQVGVAGHLKIGHHVTVGAQSGVTRDIPPGKTVAGLPAIRHREWLKAASSFEHLPKIRKVMRQLQEKVAQLEKQLSKGGKKS